MFIPNEIISVRVYNLYYNLVKADENWFVNCQLMLTIVNSFHHGSCFSFISSVCCIVEILCGSKICLDRQVWLLSESCRLFFCNKGSLCRGR